MKKTVYLIVIFLFCLENAHAYSFDAWCDTGQKLYYDITSENTVDVVGCWNPEGELCIPAMVEHNGKVYTVTRIGDEAFKECHGFYGTLTLPNTVYWIGYQSFYKCDGFTGDLTLPNSVQYIDGAAFLGCMGFTSLTIGEGMISMNAYAFGCCLGLTKIYFNAVYCENFGYHTDDYVTVRIPAFDDCFNVKEIVMGNRVQHIEPWAFEDCGDTEGLTSLTIGRDLTNIGEYAFMETRLDTLVFDAVNYQVEEDDEWWIQYTDDVQILTIGNDVTTIHKEFEDLIYVRKMTLGKSVTTIEPGAFGEYVRPDTLYMKGVVPPTIKENALQYFNKDMKIFVPCDALAAYQNASGWNEFTNYETFFPFTLTVGTNNPTIGMAEIVKDADCADNQAVVRATSLGNGTTFECWKSAGETVSYDETYSFELNDDLHLEACFNYPMDVKDIDNEDVKLYPNPTDGVFYIEGENIETIEIYNISGRLEKSYNANNFVKTPIKLCESGIYFVKITKNQRNIIIKKLIVK